MNAAQQNNIGQFNRLKGIRRFAKSGVAQGVLSAGISGGLGKAVDRAARMATSEIASKSTQRAVESYKKRRGDKLSIQSSSKSDEPTKKMAGVGFWMVFAACLLKDLLDIFTNLTVALSMAVWITTMIILFVVNFYLFYKGVKPSSKKIFWQAATLLADSLPFISMFVGYTLYIVYVRITENKELGGLVDLSKTKLSEKTLKPKHAS